MPEGRGIANQMAIESPDDGAQILPECQICCVISAPSPQRKREFHDPGAVRYGVKDQRQFLHMLPYLRDSVWRDGFCCCQAGDPARHLV
jgi:hypothetical protein